MLGRTATKPLKLGLGTIWALAFCGQIGLAQAQEPTSLPVKVVVVTMFELGEDTGDRPGEFQTWVERLPLSERIPFPQGYRDLRYNPEKDVLGLVTGIGTARSASSIMALGMDPRFDLSRAYWLVAGIAGADPNDMSIGSAAWAEWIVDGDLSHEIDPREMPEGWPTGYTPLRKAEPYAQPVPEDDEGVVYHLDPGLVDWAYQLTKDVQLADADALKQLRQRYVGYPKAQEAPKVIKGDNLAAMTFWHGKLLNDWANDWMEYWTEGPGQLRDHGHGGHRHAPGADLARQGRQGSIPSASWSCARPATSRCSTRVLPQPIASRARRRAATRPTYPRSTPLTWSAARWSRS